MVNLINEDAEKSVAGGHCVKRLFRGVEIVF